MNLVIAVLRNINHLLCQAVSLNHTGLPGCVNERSEKKDAAIEVSN